MKICLVFSGGRTLGIEYVAASLKKAGHDVYLIFDPLLFYGVGINYLKQRFNYAPIVLEKIKKINPRLVAFSVLSDTYGWACNIAEQLKQWKDVPVLFGGLHASAVPDIILRDDYVDYVCVGEGEGAAVDIAHAIENDLDTTGISNIWTRQKGEIIQNEPRDLVTDLDSLPFPGEGTYYGEFKDYRYFSHGYSILTSRGCSNKCTFCMNSLLSEIYKGKGPYLRRRSVDNVIEELKFSREKFKVKHFSFEDDVFTSDVEWLEEFCQKYKEEINLPFCCQIYPAHANEKVVAALESSGCMAVGVGIQSVDAELVKRILHREGNEEFIAHVIKIFKNSKISLLVQVLLDFPEQPEAEIVNIARFLNINKPDYVLAFRFRHYPRMKIVEIARQRNLLTDQDIKNLEESKAYAPYTMGINVFYKKNINMLLPLIIVSPDLPRKMLDFIIDKKIYLHRFLFLPFLFHLYSMFISVYKKIFSGKKRFYYFTPSGLVKYFIYYVVRRLLGTQKETK